MVWLFENKKGKCENFQIVHDSKSFSAKLVWLVHSQKKKMN